MALEGPWATAPAHVQVSFARAEPQSSRAGFILVGLLPLRPRPAVPEGFGLIFHFFAHHYDLRFQATNMKDTSALALSIAKAAEIAPFAASG